MLYMKIVGGVKSEKKRVDAHSPNYFTVIS